MNRIMIVLTALMVVVAGMVVTQEAEAGLFNRRNRNKCCEPQQCAPVQECCAPVQTCCAPAEPVCCEPAPVMHAAPVSCGCAAAPAPSCGCEAASTCGCDAGCGCEEVANCDCLNRRQLRRANRRGECCGAEPNTCNNCVQTVSYQAPDCGCSTCGSTGPVMTEGCTSCGGGTIIEQSSPTPAAGEEAAPEAPQAPDATT